MRAIVICASLLAIGAAPAMQSDSKPRPEDTEVWQPEPPLVAPGPIGSIPPPSDAIILFDGTGLDQWVSSKDKSPARWMVADGVFTVRKGTGNIETRRSFGDYQLHLEWRIPAGIEGEGQARGNSGLFLASTGGGDAGYELQILDSYRNKTYVNGQAASIYKQYAPLANSARAPGDWQSFDVLWTAPIFAADGSLTSPAHVTAFMNGVLVQDHVAFAAKRRTSVYPATRRMGAHRSSSRTMAIRARRSASATFGCESSSSVARLMSAFRE